MIPDLYVEYEKLLVIFPAVLTKEELIEELDRTIKITWSGNFYKAYSVNLVNSFSQLHR